MLASLKRPAVAAALALPIILFPAADAEAQGRGRGNREPAPAVTAEVTISIGDRARISAFYASSSRPAQEALPPGIRRNLERGKALPPGLAKRSPPQELQSTLTVSQGFEIVEVGLDVLLVEVATGIIHDVLTDLIR